MPRAKSNSSAIFSPPRTISNSKFLERGSDAKFRETIYGFVHGGARLLACREAFGRALRLTATQFTVLIGVAYRQGSSGVTVRDLSKHIALAPTHVTTEIGRLTDIGLLIKRPNASDKRSVLVSLSKAGEKAVTDVSPFVKSVNDLLFADISPADLDIVKKVADKLVANSELAMIELSRQASQKPRRAGTASR